MNFAKFFDEKWLWSKATFGPGKRTLGLTAHIRKELEEIEQQPLDAEEWVDVILLAMDGLARIGVTGRLAEEIIIRKQLVNVTRRWPEQYQPQDSPAEHIE